MALSTRFSVLEFFLLLLLLLLLLLHLPCPFSLLVPLAGRTPGGSYVSLQVKVTLKLRLELKLKLRL